MDTEINILLCSFVRKYYMQQLHNNPALSLPFHINPRHRKLRIYYEQHQQPDTRHSLENMISPISKPRRKLPISGELARKIKQNNQGKPPGEMQKAKRSQYQLNQLGKPNEEADPSQDHSKQGAGKYPRVKQIKRKNSIQSNGSAYVKQTDQQLQQRVKQFARLIQSKRLRAENRNLLEKGEYEKRVIDSEINDCQRTILHNQRMMERQARVEERLKYIKRGKIVRDRYCLDEDEGEQEKIYNSVNLRSQLSQLDQNHRVLKLNRQSLNLSQMSPRNRQLAISYQKHILTEPDQPIGQDYFHHQNQQMLKRLINLVKKKERLNYLTNIASSPRLYH